MALQPLIRRSPIPPIDRMAPAMMARSLWPVAGPRQIVEQVGEGSIAPMRLDEARDIVAARPLAGVADDDEMLLSGVKKSPSLTAPWAISGPGLLAPGVGAQVRPEPLVA